MQLYDLDKQIGLEAVDILDEACQEESFLETLVLQQPQLVHLGEKGAALLTKFFSVKRGYTLMSRLGYIDRAINMWFKVSYQYCACLLNACFTSELQDHDDKVL